LSRASFREIARAAAKPSIASARAMFCAGSPIGVEGARAARRFPRSNRNDQPRDTRHKVLN